MKTAKTYRQKAGAGLWVLILSLFLWNLPLEGAPPGGYFSFHASFHAGSYVPAVSYTARIRMFAYPSLNVGYVYDPVFYDDYWEPYYTEGYYGGWYGYGGFSVTFSYGYPSWYVWHPVWYYPVYYMPVAVAWYGPYYSYHYSYHYRPFGHRHCGYRHHYGPYYDRRYYTYGNRSHGYDGERAMAVQGRSAARPVAAVRRSIVQGSSRGNMARVSGDRRSDAVSPAVRRSSPRVATSSRRLVSPATAVSTSGHRRDHAIRKGHLYSSPSPVHRTVRNTSAVRQRPTQSSRTVAGRRSVPTVNRTTPAYRHAEHPAPAKTASAGHRPSITRHSSAASGKTTTLSRRSAPAAAPTTGPRRSGTRRR